ncbi:MAG: DUF1799 domain-containing protein [Geminicoccaceae bacterium]|nr:DUF1799 domain-containing protein [Geminicoccaceae bacterium]
MRASADVEDIDDGLFPLDPDMLPAVRVFLACATQWRRAGWTGLPAGLDYQALHAAAGMLGIAVSPDIFFDIRCLEAGALRAFAEEASRRR